MTEEQLQEKARLARNLARMCLGSAIPGQGMMDAAKYLRAAHTFDTELEKVRAGSI